MMPLPIIGIWMSIEGHRRLVQVIPDPVQVWWDKWEIRGLILLSLVSQIILTILGNRTKYKPNIWTQSCLWSAYLLADWLAAVAMGVISSNLGVFYSKGEQTENVNPQLLAFWAPFFLMHLGGPDTITAYALEDNELWLRHFVGLLSQTALTVYIIILSWKGNWLSYLTIPMLVIGIIKYGERTWSLYCGSIKHLRDSFLHSIDTSREIEQWQWQELIMDRSRLYQQQHYSSFNRIDSVIAKSEPPKGDPRTYLRAIYIFVSLFVDLVLSPWDITLDRHLFLYKRSLNKNPNIPFNLVDYELKLMYDVFYSKAFANYGIFGFMSRLITLATTTVVLVSYANLSEKKEHIVVDHIITYLLLLGALIAEVYAFILVASSAWTTHYFAIKGLGIFCDIQVCIHRWIIFMKGEKTQLTLEQSNFFNLICNKNMNIKVNFFPVKKLEETSSVSHCLISNYLQNVILRHLCDESKEGTQSNPSGAPGYRNLLLGKNVPIFTGELEFHRTIITWHIATDMFYYCNDEPSSEFDSRKNCKEMSDYMFYLLVNKRHMLPVGAGLITLRDTVIEAMEIFKHIKVVPQQDNLAETCSMLLQHDTATEIDDEASKMQSTSILFHACAVAKQLIAAENTHQTWEFIEELWVEILKYAGAQCRVDMHAHQLRRGPEFLSHVWLLQAHLGLLHQFQITPSQVSV